MNTNLAGYQNQVFKRWVLGVVATKVCALAFSFIEHFKMWNGGNIVATYNPSIISHIITNLKNVKNFYDTRQDCQGLVIK